MRDMGSMDVWWVLGHPKPAPYPRRMGGEEGYTPWPAELLPAQVMWLEDLGVDIDPRHPEGHLHFTDPDGRRAAIPITRGDHDAVTASHGGPVWGITIEDGIATIAPSVHLNGHWHSGNPVKFQLVDDLPRPARR